ncbi:lipase chaperone protein [Desulfobotulus alkaliphilus]|uniref:Lipase helper protein n=1 Tax=Desulfobotulus alkaliphilus TaxID=622671 RepID=A0A562RP45_9BACT|nr:lipase secretion chaperone [Desulfobotulus alkaliphilus]TWI70334.1 lipase chaperone protein [Desulfobotulus alkaliphilus]
MRTPFRRVPRLGWIGIVFLILTAAVLYLYPQGKKEKEIIHAHPSSDHEISAESKKLAVSPLTSLTPPVFLEKKDESSPDLMTGLMAEEKGEEVRALFAWMTQEFGQVADYVAHMDLVRAWLFENYDAQSAEAILAVYAPYIQSEMDLADYLAMQNVPQNREERLAFWEDIRNFRIAHMGENHTEWLFGREMAENRYRLDRVEIVSNPNMGAREKLQALQDLDNNYRLERDDPPPFSRNPYQQYRELLEVHKLDLAHMASDAERQERIRTLRQETLPEDAIIRMETVEQEIHTKREREKEYREKREALLRDSSLQAEEKQEKLNILQEQFFGEDAESMRRRERIAAALQERMDASEQKK